MARVFADAGAQSLATAAQGNTQLTSFSVAFWIFRTATPAATRQLIAATIAAAASAGWYIWLNLTTNLVTAGYPFTTADKTRISSTAPALNTWVHVIVVHNNTGTANTDFTFYFNGKSEAGTSSGTGSGTHDSTTATKLEIGSGNTGAAPPAQIGPVAIWNRVISPAEALALAGGMHPTRFPEGLVEYFTMESAQHEEGAFQKLFLVAGATIPTNAAVNPPMEALPSPRGKTRIGRHFVPATAGRTLFVQGALDGIGGAGTARFYPGQAA
jgi:hypothetical protein